MVKAIYFFSNGAALASRVVEASADGTLTDPESGAVLVTGATAAESPASGCYVLGVESPPAPKPDKKEKLKGE